MRSIGEKKYVLLIALVFTSVTFLWRPPVFQQHAAAKMLFDDRFTRPAFQDSPAQYDLSIESPGFNPGVSQQSRMVTIAVFPERFITLDFRCEISVFIASAKTFLTRVPIFIRGHAFLN